MQPVPLLCMALTALLPAVLTSNIEPSLPAPSNVRVDSYNMEHIVRWDPVVVKDEQVLYSVGFEMYSGFRELCLSIRETECNFTGKIPPNFRGKPKVQAELGSRKSDWVVLPDFQPNKNTIIGPVKSLVLLSHSGKLRVDFSPPFSPIPSEWTLKYKLSYWKENLDKKEMVDLNSTSTYLLDSLEHNANYCVQVYAFTHFIKGLVSDPVCESTATEITLIVVLSCVFGFVLIFGMISLLVIPERPLYKARTKIKNWLDGPYKIPSDVIDYLEDPPHSECTLNASEEPCDHISIVGLDQDVDEEETYPDHRQLSSEKT